MSFRFCLVLLLILSPGAALAQVAPTVPFPAPIIKVAVEPSGPSPTFEAPSGPLGELPFAVRVEMPETTPLGTWVTLLIHVTHVDGGASYSQWFPAKENTMSSLSTRLATLGMVESIDLSNLSAGQVPLGVDEDLAVAMVSGWLAQIPGQPLTVLDSAQYVEDIEAGPDYAGWSFHPPNWPFGHPMNDLWGRAYEFGYAQAGLSYDVFDPAALAEVGAYLQVPSASWQQFRRYDFESLMASDIDITIQAIAAQPCASQIGGGGYAVGLPAGPGCPVRLSFSQPVVVELRPIGSDPGARGHYHPTLAELTGIPNFPYLMFPEQTLTFYASRVYQDTTMVRFPTQTGDVIVPLTVVGPCMAQVLVPPLAISGNVEFSNGTGWSPEIVCVVPVN